MKNVSKVLLLGAAFTTLATTANAADINFNSYGSSASFGFMQKEAAAFLGNALTGPGCTTVNPAVVDSIDGKTELIVASGCNGGVDTIFFRYGSKSSYDGINAFNNLDPDGVNAAYCATHLTSNCCSAPNTQRPMITSAADTTLSCQDIHLAASDVAGSAFTQSSHGLKLGPMGGAQTDRVMPVFDTTTNMTDLAKTVVVPFGFFVNKSVQVSKCDNNTTIAGNLCTTGTVANDCGVLAGVARPAADVTFCTGTTTTTCAANTSNAGATCSATAYAGECGVVTNSPALAADCVTGPLDNVTREMIVNIFGSKVGSWTDFGSAYSVTGDATNKIVTCFRHAGSGSAATFDKVFYTGAKPLAMQTGASTSGTFIRYFNDGSSDEMKCINNNAALTTPGAIGYADADQSLAAFTNTVAVKYNGMWPSRNVIRNGMYDFFTNLHLYESATVATNSSYTSQHSINLLLIPFMGIAANIPATKAAYWAVNGEMRINKSTDLLYPGVKANPLTQPQIP